MGMINMKVRKMSFRNEQAWLSIEDEEGNYLGTFHLTNLELGEKLRQQKGEIRLKFILD